VKIPTFAFQNSNEFMKNRVLILAALFFLSFAAMAQITLTVSDLAGAGDMVITSSVPFTGATPATGPSQTYDFSGLQPGLFNDTTLYVAAAGTPYAADMPGANLCQIGLGSYTYFVRNNNGFNLKGFVFELPADSSFIQLPSQLIFAFSPQIPIMTFPATLGMNLNTSSTSSRVEIPFDTTINGVQITKIGIKLNILDTSKIDGWGTATFPGGEFPVLRNYHAMNLSTNLEVYTILIGNIGVWVPMPANLIPAGAGSLLGGNTKDVMLWANGRKQPLVTMSMDTLGMVTNADFQSDLLVTSNRSLVSEQASFSYYPNPAASVLNLQLQKDVREIRMLDFSGRVVKSFSGLGAGSQVQISDVNNGVYLLEAIGISGEIQRKRLVIRH
jgi:hypothetical protein